jgi:hypothetical protein
VRQRASRYRSVGEDAEEAGGAGSTILRGDLNHVLTPFWMGVSITLAGKVADEQALFGNRLATVVE